MSNAAWIWATVALEAVVIVILVIRAVAVEARLSRSTTELHRALRSERARLQTFQSGERVRLQAIQSGDKQWKGNP